MRVYISGPMTGYEEFNVPAFAQAVEELRAAGHEPISPHLNGLPVGATWIDHMKADLRMLLDAEAVATLEGWEDSRGASLECHVAQTFAMPIAALADYLQAESPDGSPSSPVETTPSSPHKEKELSDASESTP